MVYSSEHFHSRVRQRHEIVRLYDRLAPLYDRIRILVYLRRQDALALSAYNTALQAGETRALTLSRITATTPYYDYLSLLQRWAEVFGEDALEVRLFDKAHLVSGDVVADCCEVVGCRGSIGQGPWHAWRERAFVRYRPGGTARLQSPRCQRYRVCRDFRTHAFAGR